jgi:hypothetical protein
MRYLIIICVLLLPSCADIGELKPGVLKHIPYSKNIAVGTDSTIVIINRNTGETLNEINRYNQSKK